MYLMMFLWTTVTLIAAIAFLRRMWCPMAMNAPTIIPLHLVPMNQRWWWISTSKSHGNRLSARNSFICRGFSSLHARHRDCSLTTAGERP